MENQEEYDLMTADDFQEEFLIKRATIDRKINKKGSIEAEDILAEEYVNVCADAASGDAVCQDLLSYWFKRGNLALPENIELSMKWLFLAGSNGNKHSLTKLQFFLSYGYDSIIFSDNFEEIKQVFDIDETNYIFILGELLCKEIVKDLGINALELSKIKLTSIPYNITSMQRFTFSLNRSIKFVIEYLESVMNKYKLNQDS